MVQLENDYASKKLEVEAWEKNKAQKLQWHGRIPRKEENELKKEMKRNSGQQSAFLFPHDAIKVRSKKTKKRKSVLYLFFANGNTRSRRSQGLVASVKKRRTKSRLPQRSRSLPCSLRSPKLMDFFRVW